MSDSFTETTNKSWFSRIGNAFKGIVVGFILFIVAFPLLFWNEGRTIKQTKSLKETEAGLVLAKCDEVNQDFEGKPVYMTGDAKTEETLSDDYFPVTVNGFKLKRNVEMYQWVEHEKSETKKKLGGGEETVTTYSYTKEWCDSPINSGNFKLSAEHENPAWDFEGGETGAKTGSIGAFTLSESIIGKINWYEPLKVEVPAPENSANQVPANQVPANQVPANQVPANQVPANQVPANQVPANQVPANQVPANQVPANQVPANQVPAVEEAPDVPEVPAVEEAPDVPSETTADEAPAEEPAAADANNAQASEQTTTSVVSATPLAPATQTPDAIATANGVPEGYIYYKDGFYKGDPKKLAVGDVRVSFEYVPATETISLISGQQGDTFVPYQTKFNQIELVEKGVVSSDAMFKHAHNANSMICWALRLAGFLMMFFGLKMIFEPLRVIADVVPFIGSIIGLGTGFVAFVLAAGFSLLTIAIGWLTYRPLVGVPLLIAALFFLLMPFFRGKKAAPQASASFEK